jgi:hypothetical protein
MRKSLSLVCQPALIRLMQIIVMLSGRRTRGRETGARETIARRVESTATLFTGSRRQFPAGRNVDAFIADPFLLKFAKCGGMKPAAGLQAATCSTMVVS